MTAFKIEARVVEAIYYKDEINGTYTITSLHNGGPTVSAATLDEAKDKYETALDLAVSVRNLQFYKGAVKAATPKARKIFTDKMKEKIGNIQYHEFAAA